MMSTWGHRQQYAVALPEYTSNDPRLALDADNVSEPGSVPLPNDDFEPFLSEYADYDAALEQSLNNVQELDISHATLATTNFSDQILRPAQVSKYASDAYNLPMRPQTPLMSSSPTKPAMFSMQSPGRAPPLYNDMPSSPPNFGSPVHSTRVQSHHQSPSRGGLGIDPLGISSLGPPPRMVMLQQPAKMLVLAPSASDSQHPAQYGGYTSQPQQAQLPYHNHHNHSGHNHQHHHHASPHLQSPPQLDESPYMSQEFSPADSHYSPELDGTPVMSSPGKYVEWQPILTIPEDQETKKIIQSQIMSTSSKGRRKSCLPPGAVDEYMSGIDDNDEYQCLYPNCGRMFKRKYNLRSHIQTHLCDRPYLCQLCNATFVRPHDLRRHLRCHSVARPYTCPCGKGFTRMDALQRHRHRMICVGGIATGSNSPKRRGRPIKSELDTPSPTPSEDGSGAECHVAAGQF